MGLIEIDEPGRRAEIDGSVRGRTNLCHVNCFVEHLPILLGLSRLFRSDLRTKLERMSELVRCRFRGTAEPGSSDALARHRSGPARSQKRSFRHSSTNVAQSFALFSKMKPLSMLSAGPAFSRSGAAAST